MIYSELEPEDAAILAGRHRFAMCWLVADDETWVLLALGCGDPQGDGAAPDKFLHLFDPRIDRWVDATETAFERTYFMSLNRIQVK